MRKTIVMQYLAIVSDKAAVSQTFNVLTLFQPRNKPVTTPMPGGCAI